jgi:glycosyltransferase involved in cell wall biosynthesis
MEQITTNISGIKLKKILFIVQLPPPLHGASVMNNLVFNSELINSNFSVDLINLQFARSLEELKKFSFPKLFKAFLYCFSIIKRSLFYKPDLVYFTLSPKGYSFYRDSIYVFLLKLFNNKIVFHLHGKGIRESIKRTSINKHVYNWVFKNTYVICLSQRLTNDLEGVYKSLPYIVPNGIRMLPEIEGKEFEKHVSVPQILFLSNYIRDKGILTIIDALNKLKKQGYIFNSRLVGAPVDLSIEFLKGHISDLNLSECIQITGPLFNDEKMCEFRNADIFCFPTYNDAFPLVILEAMQFSLPVISTFEGGIPDIVIENETGFLVDAQNPEILADKISILLKDKQLRIDMGKKGHERFINNFTLTHFENNIYKTFQAILDI